MSLFLLQLVKDWRDGKSPKQFKKGTTQLKIDQYYYHLIEMMCRNNYFDFDEVLRYVDKETDDLGEVETYAEKRPGEIRRLKKGECTAHICHGPGHQSVTKKHIVHAAYYGSYNQFAKWKGNEVCSGYFDEAPELEE